MKKGAATTLLIAALMGFLPGASGESLSQEKRQVGGGGAAAEGSSPAGKTNFDQDPDPRRNLQTVGSTVNDDAVDLVTTPAERAANARDTRKAFADIEFEVSAFTIQEDNSQRATEAMFHKTLPHDDLGQVSNADFLSLLTCIEIGEVGPCEAVPAGLGRTLANPLGARGLDMAGPANSAVVIPPAPLLSSPDLAAQMAEVYWMALTRDVPFSEYGTDPMTILAADNLATMPGFPFTNDVAVDENGRADPQTQLFRSTAFGVTTGPYISQLLVRNYTIDSTEIEPRLNTLTPGVDYMITYDDWLFIQNGGIDPLEEELDDIPRFIRNSRDLARVVDTDTINTEAYRSTMILLEDDIISRPGFNGPYIDSVRQEGFVSYGTSHIMKLLGVGEMAQRASWYQKWNLHMLVRPEALGGALHNTIIGDLVVEFDPSLLTNTVLQEAVFAHNEAQNGVGGGTYLLPQASRPGSPTHPSYPSGHATQNGAFATVMKAMVGLERGLQCFPNPIVAAADGLTVEPYTGTECLTYEGEINKMAANVAIGRQMLGVHYRCDSIEGMTLGETIAVRILHQELMGLAEGEPYEFHLLGGETIRLEADGTFFIDGVQCTGEAYTGVDACT